MNYKRDIANNYFTQIIRIAVIFLTSIIVVRTLAPQGRGVVTYFSLVFTLIATYGDLGVNLSTTYFQKRSGYTEQTVYNIILSYLLIVSVILSIIIILLKVSGVFLQEFNVFLIAVGILFFFFTMIKNCHYRFYIGNEKISQANKYFLISLFIKTILILAAWLSYTLNITSYIIFELIEIVISTVLLKKHIGFEYQFRWDGAILKSQLKYGIVVYFSNIFNYLNYRVDQLLIKGIVGTKALGIYSVGTSLAELLLLLPESVSVVLLGKLYNIKPEDRESKTVIVLTAKYSFYSCLILAVIGIFMSPLIPVIYGDAFKKAKSVMVILFIGLIFASIGKVINSYFYTKGRPDIYLKIVFVTFIVNFILNLMLIPIYGINGAAAASAVSYTIYGLIHIGYFKYVEKYAVSEFFTFNSKEKEMIKGIINKGKLKLFRCNRK